MASPSTEPESKPTVVVIDGAHTYSVPNVVSCGHTAHVGSCPACQRIQLQRQAAHLAAAQAARARWQAALSGLGAAGRVLGDA